MALSICIPTYNRLPYLKQLIASIRNGIGNYQYEIIVADGGSTDGTVEFLKKQEDVVLIEMNELTGSIKAYNKCFKKAKHEYIFWPSDDFIIIPSVLIKCCNLMDNYPEIGLVSTKMQDDKYSNFPSVGKHRYLILSKTHVFRKSVLEEMNFFDETYRTYFIDGDSTLTVLTLGYTIIFTREVGVIHNRVQDDNYWLNRESMKDPHEINHHYEKWNDLNYKLDTMMQSYPLKKLKSLLFFHLRLRLFDSRLMQSLMARNNPFALQLYDWVLQQFIVFNASEQRHLKDFYLAQKLPKNILQ